MNPYLLSRLHLRRTPLSSCRRSRLIVRYRLRSKSQAHSSLVADHSLQPGLYEALLTGALDKRLADLVVAAVTPEIRALADAEAADRLSRHVAMVVTRAIEALPEHGRAQAGAQIISRLIDLLSQVSNAIDRDVDLPLDPARLHRILELDALGDGDWTRMERPSLWCSQR